MSSDQLNKAEHGDIALVVPSGDAVANAVPARWAADELRRAIEDQGGSARTLAALEDAHPSEFCVLVSAMGAPPAESIIGRSGIVAPTGPESLCLLRTEAAGRSILLAAGTDARGLAYALTELADRVTALADRHAALEFADPVVEQPASRVRSMLRGFNSEVEDKPWFYDRDYWRAYLDMLAYSRVNRLHFATGMAYNLAQKVTDGYLLFPYPFLVDVPGHAVRVRGLPEEERVRNLDTLRFVGEECARRGLDFHLGIWTLAHEWPRSPKATYMIEGLTNRAHGSYCHAALALLLQEVPSITGVTFRVHEESGIPRGQESFWDRQFRALAECGRRVDLDLHAKSMSPETLDLAHATGQSVTISPKYCGEHQALPYHQASIRRLERARPGAVRDPGTGVLVGDRGFTRYGYADCLAENRTWDVLFRIWPGTQRFLLGADPALLAGYGRQAAFCDAAGIELSEPLHFKGRRGSGRPGERCGYADASLAPARDFEKYRYFYRLWGRLGFNPDTAPDVWRRELLREFGSAAGAIERALAAAGRVLPLFTLAHAPSADCVRYWPEVYSTIPLDEGTPPPLFHDTLAPKLFGNISSFDPQLFQSPDECAESLLFGPTTGRYTPLEVAVWLEDLATVAGEALAEARADIGAATRTPGFRRIEEDVFIQRGLALFFAGKLRAAILWRIHVITGNVRAAETAIALYAAARDDWATMAQRAAEIYRPDLGYGETLTSGHWLDRLPAIDEDLANLRRRFAAKVYQATQLHYAPSDRAVADATHPSPRVDVAVEHAPRDAFFSGQPLPVALRIATPSVTRVRLHYRPINHAEHWQAQEMTADADTYTGAIPARVTAGRFPLQYYFEIFVGATEATLYPPLAADLANLPYFVARLTA